jgi:hypothetical protein
MARRSDEFVAAWDSLASTGEPASGWRSISIAAGGIVSLRAGRRFPGNEESLLAGFAATTLPAAEKLPDGQGFAVERVDPLLDGKTWLALTRRSSGSAELFLTMACDVAGALDAEPGAPEPRALRVFLGRVRAWQEFMRKGAQPLGPEAEVGLVGELLTLSGLIEAGVPADTVCAAWLGPLDGLRDFEIGTGGVEVKSSLSAVGFPARIGSLEQLDDSVRQPLFVVGVRLRQVPEGESLPGLIESIRDIVRGDAEAERLLSERLVAAGYFDAHSNKYTRQFVGAGTRVVEVAEGFPRLTPGRVPAGVSRASYEIDLDRVPGVGVSIEEMLRKLGAL